jgi:Rod binding domain-containing protein
MPNWFSCDSQWSAKKLKKMGGEMTTISQPSLTLPVATPFSPDSNLSEATRNILATQGAQRPTTGQAGSAQSTTASPEVVGRGFEEIFASILVKQMRQTVGEGGMFGHDPGDVLGGMFDHFMSQHIASTGSLGIGKMIQKHLESGSVHP